MRQGQEEEKKRDEISEYTCRGEESHHAGRLKDAVENYRKAYQIVREINDDTLERTCALNLGAACIAADNPEEGLRYLQKATPPNNQRDEPSNGPLYFNKGLGYEKLGETRNALESFKKAFEEYKLYERMKEDLLIQCLEKCLCIHETQNQHLEAANVCKELADVFQDLARASKLCERITHLRCGDRKDEAFKEGLELLRSLNDMELEGEECLQAARILNDLGLAFTLLLKYEHATECFEKAAYRIQCSHKPQDQLEAVVMQNLGAAYNFMGDFQRAVKFHENAVEKYGKTRSRNFQGQCFINLAYALTQCGNLHDAEVAFHHSLLASKDTSDPQMEWQALEGLGAVNFSQGNYRKAVDFYMRALQTIGTTEPGCSRIKNKILMATQYLHGSRSLASTPRAADVSHTLKPLFEEHAQVVPTPREEAVVESQIVEEQIRVQGPNMATVEETKIKKKRLVPVRKSDSIGPHAPKISRGLASSLGFTDSPRRSLQMTSFKRGMLEEESGTDDSSQKSSSSLDDSLTDKDDIVDAQQAVVSSKVNEIFRKPNRTLHETYEGDLHSEYERQLLEKERKEEDGGESSEESGDDDSEDGSDEDDSSDHEERGNAPPTLPTQSPPNTALASQSTYLKPSAARRLNADMSSHSGRQEVTERKTYINEQSEEEEEEEEGEELYATVDKSGQLQSTQAETEEGNKSVGSRQRNTSDGRRGENFFESDASSPPSARKAEEIMEESEEVAPYHSINDLHRDGEAETSDGQGVRDFQDLPRGQRERVMAEYHQKHERGQGEGQIPPGLPQRTTERQKDASSTKFCNIM